MRRGAGLALLLVALAAPAPACRNEMHSQARYDPLEASDFFGDGRSARQLLPGTVARGHLRADDLLNTGKVGGVLADAFPFPVTREVMARGKERYEIYCTPCHDRAGTGQGMVVRRGFRAPPTLHIDRLRAAPAGYFFDVITRGFGAMADYSAQVGVRDRWAVVAYIRALQLSQHAQIADVAEGERGKFEGTP
jgi:hypothetical protein